LIHFEVPNFKMKYTRHVMHTLYFDGCSKGNPGRAGAGAVLYDAQEAEVFAESVFVGFHATNNEAEYTGLILGLTEALKRGITTELLVRGDSQLIVRQMQGKYKVNSPKLAPLHKCATTLASKFAKIDYEHVYRDKNQRADALSNVGETNSP
jgi:ribonuclease HI/probable phosphoglycerate mutase